MTFLNELFSPYSFKGLIELIINKLGFSSLIVIFGAYIAAIIYFCAVPSKGRFSTDFPRTNAAGFFQQVFYAFSIVIVLMPFISGWSSFFLVLGLYGLIIIPLIFNVRIFVRDFTFSDYVRFKNTNPALFNNPMRREYSGIGSIWVALLAELFAFFYFNPTIPIVGWAIILYTLAAAFLLCAFTQSILFNARSCPYVKIITADGIVEGFLVAKGEDNYAVMTKEGDILLSSEYVKSISPAVLPKQTETKHEHYDIKIGPCPYPELHRSNKSHHCLVIDKGVIKEAIYLYPNDCEEYTPERVILHESIHALLYHFFDEQKFRSLLPQLINGEIDFNDEYKKLVSTKYDAWENWFSSLVEDWDSQHWNTLERNLK